MGHSGPNGPTWTRENIRKAHIRLDDEDALMGPFSSGPLLLPAPLAHTPRVRGGLELLPLSRAVAGRGGGPAAAVVGRGLPRHRDLLLGDVRHQP